MDDDIQVKVGDRVMDASEVQRLIPQLEETIEKKEALIRQQQGTIGGQLRRITELENDVKSLQVCSSCWLAHS